MKDLSYHILDIVQNSLHAGARLIEVTLLENCSNGLLKFSIRDNGSGMSPERIHQALDPFFTTSVAKKVGLGLPLLKQNAELTGGTFEVESVVGKGTTIVATFITTHIDMIPTGDLASTFKILVAANPDCDFVYRHVKDQDSFELDTAVLRENLEDVPLNTPEVLDYISDYLSANMKALTLKK